MSSTSICIIGAGAAGLITLILLSAHIPPEKIVIIDPYFDGGDLQRKWPAVRSNTIWKATLTAFGQGVQPPSWANDFDPEAPTTLSTIARLIREIAAPYLAKAKQIQCFVRRANWDSASSRWLIETGNSKIIAQSLIVAVGGEPKNLDLPIPSIPLEIALDSRRLKDYIRPGETVAVFGTRHSGVLALKSILDCSANAIGIYKGSKPFIWARDGEYDGLKQDAAKFADDFIGSSAPSNLRLLPLDDVSGLVRATRGASWVIYAMGFMSRDDITYSIDGTIINDFSYDGRTGKLQQLPNAWGFGLAYPSQAPDGEHWDVGIGPFVEHIKRQMESIRSTL